MVKVSPHHFYYSFHLLTQPIIIGKSAKPWGPRSVQQAEDMEAPFPHGTCVVVGRYTINKKTELQMVISIAKIINAFRECNWG